MIFFHILGWISTLLVISGRFLIAYKKRSGFVCVVVGGIGIGVQAYMIDNWSIVFLSLVLGIVDTFGWFYWGRHAHKKEEEKDQEAIGG